MRAFVRKLVAILLLVTLPLQGLSAALMSFHCAPAEQYGEISVGTQQHHQNAAKEQGGSSLATAQHDGNAPSSEVGQLCCNHVCSYVPSVAILTAPNTPFVYENHISIIPPLFFPEQLLRPPRT